MTTTEPNEELPTVNEAGRERRRRAQGKHADRLQAILVGLDEGLAEYADDFIFGQVWGRPGMEFEERMLVAITALAAQGNTAQLRNYLHGALQDGMSAAKLRETMVMLTVYCGFPTALGGTVLLNEVFEAARKQGMSLDVDEG